MTDNAQNYDDLEKYTKSQKKAILTFGKDTLVAASAGSGKTMVLIERILHKLKSGVNIDEILVVTFTEAAAKEMRERLFSKLKNAISTEKNSQIQAHLIRQLDLLPLAYISTLHAFCLQVIRQFFYLIDIDPVFRILTDETEQLLIKEDVWEKIREEYYASEDVDFYHLTNNFSNDRSDDGLTELIFSLYSFSCSNPNPKKWLESMIELYKIKDDIMSHPLFQEVIKPDLLLQLQNSEKKIERVITNSEGISELDKRREQLKNDYLFLIQLRELIELNNCEDSYWLLQKKSFDRLATIKKTEDVFILEVAELLKKTRNEIKKEIQSMKDNFFAVSPADIYDVLVQSSTIFSKLVEVTNKFSHSFFKQKQELNVLDFNDLEHLTLKILQETNGTPSEASRYFRNRFKEVLVDEYQDTNMLQEQILFWLRNPSKTDGNYFMVGDVKQSIYAFRQADPTLFIEKYNKFEDNIEGERIILAENFRSRSEVLSFTNLIFSQLMDEEVGQMIYDNKARLEYGFLDFPKSNKYSPEILIYTLQKNDSEDDSTILEENVTFETKIDGELSIVANKINQLIQTEFKIYDKSEGKMRAVNFSDIVLLTPTRKNNLALLEIFKTHNIPVHVNDAQNYFQATEVQIMISLLKIIDNPYQDIPLVSVLRSPIVGLNENELAYIRSHDKGTTFYDAFRKTLDNECNASINFHMPPTFYETIHLFDSHLRKWRKISSKNDVSTLISTIYQDTGFLDYVGGLPSGKQRQNNLRALYERAANYEQMSYKGLFQFIRFIEEMQKRNKDLAEPTSLISGENAVRVMTIHGSKGLEFPIVFVLDASKKFNFSDLNQRYVFDSNLGIGIQYLDEEERVLYPTLPFFAIREEKKKKILSEEMRKLYVALTRAEQKLFIIGSYKDEGSAWKEWAKIIGEPELILPQSVRKENPSFLKWIGMTLIRHPVIEQYQQHIDRIKVPKIENQDATFKISFIDNDKINQDKLVYKPVHKSENTLSNEKLDVNQIHQMNHSLNFFYEFERATKTTSYQSVSEIKRLFEDPDDLKLEKLNISNGEYSNNFRYTLNSLNEPQFLEKNKKPTSLETGTATHLLMQLLDFSYEINRERLEELKNQLVLEKRLSIQVANTINLDKIEYFFQTDFGREIIKNNDKLVKEQPFSMLISANELFDNYPPKNNDKILVHGIIDGYYETESELVLFDYKTDYIKNNDAVETIVKKYTGQINLYRRALEFTLGRKVTKSLIIFLSSGKTVEID